MWTGPTDATRRIQELEREVTTLREAHARLTEQLAERYEAWRESERRLNESEERRARQALTIHERQESWHKMREQVEALTRERNEAYASNERLSGELDEARARNVTLTNTNNDLNVTVAYQLKRLSDAEQAWGKAERQIAAVRAYLPHITSGYWGHSNALVGIRTELEALLPPALGSPEETPTKHQGRVVVEIDSGSKPAMITIQKTLERGRARDEEPK